MAGLSEINNPELILGIARYAGELIWRVIPMLIAAVFLAESARLWLGDERLRLLLAGRHTWTGRLRAAVLGAVLPFCECGAFPVMLGLIRAGVPTGAVLTFFLISPVVSMPAFMILIGVFGLPLAISYLLITTTASVSAVYLLESAGKRRGIFKDGIAVNAVRETMTLPVACDSYFAGPADSKACCSTSSGQVTGDIVTGFSGLMKAAWSHTVSLLKRIFPYMAIVIVISALLRNLVPHGLIEQVLADKAPYDILIGALIGIPVYSGDCAMIALAAPLIGATGAVGAGIAFIIAGSGTSISGIVFMSAVFKRHFLILYVFTVFCIALITGYLISILLTLGLI